MKIEDSIVSALTDGEIESPWKERLEARIASDPALSDEYNRLQRVKTWLSHDDFPDFSASRERVRQVLAARLTNKANKPSLIRGRVSVSWPAAAAAVFVMVLGGLFLGYSAGSVSGSSRLPLAQSAPTSDEIQVQVPQKFNFKLKGEGQLLHMSRFKGSGQ